MLEDGPLRTSRRGVPTSSVGSCIYLNKTSWRVMISFLNRQSNCSIFRPKNDLPSSGKKWIALGFYSIDIEKLDIVHMDT